MFSPFQGPRVFEFKDPDVPRLYKGESYSQLYAQIRGYRSQNGLPEIPYLETVVENYLCGMPIHKGLCTPRPKFKRGIYATIRGGVSLLVNLAYNSFATQEVADARSEVCKDCSLNQFPDKTDFVKWADDIAQMSVGDRRSINHDALGNCMGCSCLMRSKVFFNGKIVLSDEQKELMSKANAECWQVKESK